MTLTGIFEFYDRYFNYGKSINSKENKYFYLAIRDFIKILKKSTCLDYKSTIEDYISNKCNNDIAIKFLRNFEKFIYSRGSKFLFELEFCEAYIIINKGELETARKGIKIPFVYLLDKNNSDCILITYFTSGSMLKETEVFKGLISSFKIDKSFPENIENIVYWDVSSGKESKINYKKVKETPKKNLLAVINQI